jgi:hypothetical protein
MDELWTARLKIMERERDEARARVASLEAALREIDAKLKGLKGTRPSYDPCGRGRPGYEITSDSFDALAGAVADGVAALSGAAQPRGEGE